MLSTRYTWNVQEHSDQVDPEHHRGSRRVRLEGKTGQYRELKREAARAVRRDKKAQVRGLQGSGEPLVVN